MCRVSPLVGDLVCPTHMLPVVYHCSVVVALIDSRVESKGLMTGLTWRDEQDFLSRAVLTFAGLVHLPDGGY